jgi:hypothetical protein
MYQIERGLTKELNEIAYEHYLKLNFKDDEVTPLVDSPVSYLFALYENYKRGRSNLRKHKAAFFNNFIIDDYALIEEIFLCVADDFPKLIRKINRLLARNNLIIGDVIEDLKSSFPYDNWRKTKRAKWLYYELNISICPYCNQSEIFKTKIGKKLYLDYDHYYKQSAFPYLALSFHNLIPSCHACNSTAKGTANFCTSTYLHPYRDNYHHVAKFGLTHVPMRFDDPFEIIINSIDAEYKKKLANFNEDLEIIDRYNSGDGQSEVINVKKKVNAYSDTQLQEFINDPNLININSRQDAINFISDFPLNESEILKYKYGKLKFDMAILFEIF